METNQRVTLGDDSELLMLDKTLATTSNNYFVNVASDLGISSNDINTTDESQSYNTDDFVLKHRNHSRITL